MDVVERPRDLEQDLQLGFEAHLSLVLLQVGRQRVLGVQLCDYIEIVLLIYGDTQ